MYRNTVGSFLLILLYFLTFIGCTNSKKVDEKEAVIKDSVVSIALTGEETYEMPEPMDVGTTLKGLNADYKETLLSSTLNSPVKYPTKFKQALNLGIYAVDLGYTTVYEQRQTSLNYLSAIQKLADELNILGAFEQSVINRFEANKDNSDSLTFIILSTFNKMNAYLNDNNRKDVTLLILTGSFIEGLYISNGIYINQKSENLRSLIGQQKLFLDNLLQLLPKYSDQQDIAHLINDLKQLRTKYEEIIITYSSSKLSSTKNIKEIKITEQQISDIFIAVTNLRNQVAS